MKTRYPEPAIGAFLALAIALTFGPTPALAHEEPDAAAPSEVAAEEPPKLHVDQRLTGGIYVGAGYAGLSTPGDHGLFDPTPSTPDGWAVGAVVVGHIGYRTLRDNYVELVTAGWFGTVDGEFGSEEWSLSFVGGAYRICPWKTGPFLRVGLGAGFATGVLPTEEGELEYNDYGAALLGSLGWDTALTERASVGPVVDAFYIDVGDDVNSLLVTAGLGITWR